MLVGTACFAGGFLVLFAPWWARTLRELSTERRERVRAQERADMASHVHDSVLQTLSLIQKAAGDPREVVRLARIQERELRHWLFDPATLGRQPDQPATLAGSAAELEREIEDSYGVGLELIVVGDCLMDDDVAALVAAGREASVNAAKWSGAPEVSVFVEVEPTTVSMFVRDLGTGFEPGLVPADRQGISRSIVERMEPPRRTGRGAQHPRIGHRGRAGAAPPDRPPMSGDGRTRVFVVDDHALIRSGIRAELGDAVDVVGEADEVDAAVELICERLPDVVLLDVHMPGGGGRAVLDAGARPSPPRWRSWRCRCRMRPRTSSTSSGQVHAATSPRTSRDRSWSTPSAGSPEGTPSSRRGWPGFVLDAFAGNGAGDRSAPVVDAELDQLTPRERRCCGSSPGATRTRRSPVSSGSRRRPSRATCPPSCGSCS